MNVTLRTLPCLLLLACNMAGAVKLHSDPSGEVLIFPFFNATNGWDTYIDLKPADFANPPSILKLKIRDGDRGAVVNSFSIYLYGAENWRAAITVNAVGEALLRIAEGSCTIAGDFQFGGAGTDFPLGTDLGTIEVYRLSARLAQTPEVGVTECGDIADRWRPLGDWRDDPMIDMSSVFGRGRVAGSAELVNVQQGVAVSMQPLGLVNFADEIPHTGPFASTPTLADAKPVATRENGAEIVPESGEGIDAVALTIGLQENSTLLNQVINADEIAARTDWVLSYPLAGYKDYRPFTADIDGESRACETFGVYTDTAPAVQMSADQSPFLSWGGGKINESPFVELTPSPFVDVEPAVCHAVNVIVFDGDASVLLAEDSPNITRVTGVLANEDSSALQWRVVEPQTQGNIGRPVVGFRVTTFLNGTLQGGSVLANYGVVQPHIKD